MVRLRAQTAEALETAGSVNDSPIGLGYFRLASQRPCCSYPLPDLHLLRFWTRRDLTSSASEWRGDSSHEQFRCVGLIDRRIRGVTSRLDVYCTFVTIDSWTVTSYGVCRVLITSWAEIPWAWRGFAGKVVEARHRMMFRDQRGSERDHRSVPRSAT